MKSKLRSLGSGKSVRVVSFACIALLIESCQTTGSGTSTLPVTPMCTVLCEVSSTSVISWNGQIFVADRTDASVDHGFEAFRPMSNPRGNPAFGFTNPTGVPDTYGISEAWLRLPGAPEVYRAQATPQRRTNPSAVDGYDYWGSAWNISRQNPSGVWSTAFALGSANRGDEAELPEDAAQTVPRLMSIGIATPQMFACAGTRTQDRAERTTALIETTGGVAFLVQDILNGDDHWLPVMAPLNPTPPTPPVPPVSGPGDPIRTGPVLCAMTQLDDDRATRELHVIAIRNGVLYHSLFSNFGPVTDAPNRFRTVSAWGDVGAVLGGGFGTITAAAIVGHPTAISIFFVAESGGRYRLWHTVRFSAGGGSWRQVKDVLALSGDAPTGTAFPIHVSAGMCPELGATIWDASNTETLVALWGGGAAPLAVRVIRVVSTARQWQPGINGFYSPWRTIPAGALGGPFLLRNAVVTARPFRDDGMPP